MCKLTLLLLISCIAYSSTYSINPDKMPVLKEEPAEILFKDGEPVNLRCVTEDNNKNVEYTWEKDEKAFDIKNNKKFTTKNGEGSFTITNPSASDEGKYRCIAKSNYGTARTKIIELRRSYIETAKYVTKDVKPVKGKPFQLECPTPKGYPKPSIKWMKNEDGTKKDFMDRRATISPDGTLYFSNATADDASDKIEYVCVADDVPIIGYYIKEVVETNEQTYGELVPQYLSSDFVAKVGDLTYIYCIYGGTPLAHPDWFKDGKNVNNKPGDRVTRHNRSSGRRLRIRETLLEDEGTYTCDVDNQAGKTHKHSMKLTVVSVPTFKTKPESEMLVESGEKVLIPCQVEGVPKPQISWTYNGEPITQGVSDEGLVIKQVEKKNQGYYGCTATNEYGSLYFETALQVAK